MRLVLLATAAAATVATVSEAKSNLDPQPDSDAQTFSGPLDGFVQVPLPNIVGKIFYSCELVKAPSAQSQLDPVRAAAAAAAPAGCPSTLFYGSEALNFTVVYMSPSDSVWLGYATVSILKSPQPPMLNASTLLSTPTQSSVPALSSTVFQPPAQPTEIYTAWIENYDSDTFSTVFDPASPRTDLSATEIDSAPSAIGVPIVADLTIVEMTIMNENSNGTATGVALFPTAHINIVNATKFIDAMNPNDLPPGSTMPLDASSTAAVPASAPFPPTEAAEAMQSATPTEKSEKKPTFVIPSSSSLASSWMPMLACILAFMTACAI